MSGYLTPAELKMYAASVQPRWVDELEVNYPGFLTVQLASYSSIIDARLAKRYATPFSAPYPEQVKKWLAALVAPEVYRRNGYDPSDQQSALLESDRSEAFAQLRESADAVDGMFELPVRSDIPSSDGVSRGRILSSSDATPYGWLDRQRQRTGW